MIGLPCRALAAVVVSLLALSACSGSGDAASTPTDPTPTRDAAGPFELEFNVAAMAKVGPAVWAIDGTRLVELDPETGEAITAVSLELGPHSVRGTPAGSEAFDDDASSGFVGRVVGTTEESVWVAGAGRGPLVQVDAATGEVAQTITAAGFTTPVVAGDDRVFAAADVHSVAAVDPVSGDVTATTRTGPICAMALDQRGALWVAAHSDDQDEYSLAELPMNREFASTPVRLLRLDAESLEVTVDLDVHDLFGADCQLAGATDGVWLVGHGDDADTVVRIDGDGQVIDRIPAQRFCCGPLAASEHTLWFIDRTDDDTAALAVLKRWHVDRDEVETIELADQIGVGDPFVQTMLLLDDDTALVTARAGDDPTDRYLLLVVVSS